MRHARAISWRASGARARARVRVAVCGFEPAPTQRAGSQAAFKQQHPGSTEVAPEQHRSSA
eukprot:4634238-Lingulodinium_polyedra.AAC.1